MLRKESNRKGTTNGREKIQFIDHHKLQSGVYVSSDSRFTGSIYQSEQCKKNNINGWLKTTVSSNILLEYDDESAVQGKSMSFSANGNAVFKVSVCNYAQGDDGKYASEDITYKINVSLIDQNGKTVTDLQILSAYKWNDTSFSNLTQPTEDTLTGGTASNHVYSVTVPTAAMKKYKIKITAVPTSKQYKALGRILYFSEDIASSEWKITYLSDEQNQNAYDLGCIHIKLTGSEYARLTLTWD